MATPASRGEDVARFEDEARAAGLVLPPPRRLRPGFAAAVMALLVIASLVLGYASGWANLSRPPPDPLSEIPGCGDGLATLTVGTESNSSTDLNASWPALAGAFSEATGGCLSVRSMSESSGFEALSSRAVDALVGSELPAVTAPGNLSGATTDVPLLVAPLVVLVNDGGASPEVNLTADALAGIYLGHVTAWSDPLLASANPGLGSDLAVTPVYQTGPAASNLIFSSYLAQRNLSFRAAIVPSENISWPVGLPAASPAALVSLVEGTPGAVGYEPSDLCPSLPAAVVCASVEAMDGSFVAPDPGPVAAAADVEANSSAAGAGDWANVSGVAPANSSVYPMVETTFAIVYRDLGSTYGPSLGLNASKWLIALLFWIASDTGGTAGHILGPFGYVALPSFLAIIAEEADLGVTYLGSWVLLPPGSVSEGGGEGGEGGGETGEF